VSSPLRFPWGSDEPRREVAPSVFRPRTPASPGRLRRSHASRPEVRRGRDAQPAALSRAAAMAVASTRLSGRTRTTHASREVARDRVPGRVVEGPRRDRHEPDYLLLLAAVSLAALGVLMVYSTSGVIAAAREGSVLDGVTTQLSWALVGGLALVLATRLDYRYWRRFSVLGFVVAVGLLALVLVEFLQPFVQPVTVGGAARWLRIGGLPAFHPAEFAKLAVVVYLAHWMTTRGSELGSVRRGLIPFLVLAALVIGLVAIEPDLGTTGVLTLTLFTMFLVAGGSILQVLLVIPLGVAAVIGLLVIEPYQMQRITTFMDPWADAAGAGYQTVQGVYALAMGGVFGIGLGASSRPGGLDLPNRYNDFIFASVGEELGMIGAVLVIGLFLLLAWRGIRVAMQAPDTFGGLLALGITAWLCFQASINIGVVVNLLPLTGLPLPFVSDGGSSLVVSMVAVGILLSISREIPRGETSHEDPHRGRWHRRPHLPRLGRGLATDRPAS
jgi:cell division protein FtsW